MSSPESSSPRPRSRRSPVEVPFFGKLTLSNLLEWFVVLGVGGAMAFQLLQYGAARPETQLLAITGLAGVLGLMGLVWVARIWDGRLNLPWGIFGAAAALLAGWLLLGSRGPGNALEVAASGLPMVLVVTLLFLVSSGPSSRAHLCALLVFTLAAALYGAWTSFDQFLAGRPNSPAMLSLLSLGLHNLGTPEVFRGAAIGSMMTPHGAAMLQVVAAVLCVTTALAGRVGREVAVLLFLLGAVFAFSSLLTVNPVAWFTLFPLLAVAPLLVGNRRRSLVIYSVVLLLAAAGGLVALPLFQSKVATGLATTFSAEALAQRDGLQDVAWELVRESPWVGVGAGNYAVGYQRLAGAESGVSVAHPASDFAYLLAERGVLGVVLVYGLGIALLGYLAWHLARLPVLVMVDRLETVRGHRPRGISARRATLATILLGLAALLVGSFFGVASTTPAVWLLGAVLAGAGLRLCPLGEVTAPNRAWVGWSCVAATGVLMITLIAWAWLVVPSVVHADEALRRLHLLRQNTVTEGLDPRVVDTIQRDLDRARRRFPTSVTLLTAEAEVLLLRGYADLRAARAYAEAALPKLEAALVGDPRRLESLVLLGIARWMAGDPVGAGTALGEATRQAPQSFEAWFHYTTWLNEFGLDRRAVLAALEHCETLGAGRPEVGQLREKILMP